MKMYNPDSQREICGNKNICHFGNYPTVAQISNRFGKEVAVAWIVPQLSDLSEFCGCKGKITPKQIKECAWLIAQNYFYLKISELMLFFSRFKQGKYGHFYGSVDPMLIMSSLQDFLRERNDAIFDMESEKNMRHEQEARKNAMTRAEYLEFKRKQSLK